MVDELTTLTAARTERDSINNLAVESAVNDILTAGDFRMAWNELQESLADWIYGRDRLGTKLTGHIKSLHDLAIERHGNKCFVAVAGFSASRYSPGFDLDHAISVQFLLELFNRISVGKSIKSNLKKHRDALGDLSDANNSKQRFATLATALRFVPNLVARGEPDAKCQSCNRPLELHRYELKHCTACYEDHGEIDEIKRQFTESVHRIKLIELETKLTAANSLGSVTAWVDQMWDELHTMWFCIKAAFFDVEEVCQKATAIEELIVKEYAAGKLKLGDCYLDILRYHCQLASVIFGTDRVGDEALKNSEIKARKILLKLKGAMQKLPNSHEEVCIVPMEELLEMIGITASNLYGCEGTFRGKLPDDWYRPTDTKSDTEKKIREKRKPSAAALVCGDYVRKEMKLDPTNKRNRLVKDWIEIKKNTWEGKPISFTGITKMLQDNPDCWK